MYSIKPFAQPPYPAGKPATAVSGNFNFFQLLVTLRNLNTMKFTFFSIEIGTDIETGHPPAQAPWEGRAIATHKFRLLEFSAYMDIQRDEIVRTIVTVARNPSLLKCLHYITVP